MNQAQAQTDTAGGVALRAIAGQVATTALTTLLAGALSLEEFEAYAVSASLFLLMVAVAPLGADKAAVRVLPPLIVAGDRRRIAGFLRFALRRIAIGIPVVALLGLLWGRLLPHEIPAPLRLAMIAAALALPGGVLAQFGLEVLTAGGRGTGATTIGRVLVPGAVLAWVGAAMVLEWPLSGATAIGAWGVVWIAGLVVMLALIRRERWLTLGVQPLVDKAAWGAAAWPLWLYRVAVILQAQAGILALEWAGASPISIGAYAAATALVSPVLVLATATNRVYAREIAMRFARHDAAGLAALARQRRVWLMPPLAAFLALVLLMPERLLAFFRPEFAGEGAWAIRILAMAAVVSASFALSPIVLKYRDRNALLFKIILCATGLQMLLLLAFVPALGAAGTALSYAASVVVMYSLSSLACRSELAA